MTPFEVSLDSELSVEWQRFNNDWLFKWYGMTYEGGVTDVDDFRGGRIHYGGITFGYQQQQIYWQAINRYLVQKVHESFKWWETETQSYPSKTRRASIDGVEQRLHQFVSKILQIGLDTDRRLRGSENTAYAGTHSNESTGGAEILRLVQAHRALLDERIKNETAVPVLTRKQRIETFLSNHKGILSLIRHSGSDYSRGAEALFGMTGMTNGGAQFEILVDGKTRSYRDRREVAIEAAQFLKGGSPHVEVAVRDVRTNISTPVIWKTEISATPMKVG